MKVLLIGATGTIGQKVQQRLAQTHDIITVGYKNVVDSALRESSK